MASSQNYNFSFEGGRFNAYLFQTASDIGYELRFTPSDYIFRGTEFAPFTFEFSILVLSNPTGKNPPFDAIVARTIAAIFYDFYTKSDEQIVIYICDSSDRREAIRKSKFDRWFEHFSGSDYIKTNENLLDANGGEYFVSLIIKRRNPYRVQIVEAFFQLLDTYNSDK